MHPPKPTAEQRRRKNVLFEQERAASQDFDLQRAGGVKSKPPKKDARPKSKARKSTH